MFTRCALMGAVAAIAFAVAPVAHAEFKLDSRYQDADGDLVADIPTDTTQLVDPDTLIFAYTPVEDPAVYAEASKPSRRRAPARFSGSTTELGRRSRPPSGASRCFAGISTSARAQCSASSVRVAWG